ncbi:uncharacterized protein LOC107036027 [Diachasma alloeum]|uniref:uncharacterized protein LOC107036027 n=1 Tax=Diachasma alloeum TaxID=454923 RepID=UPI0007382E03|nr:uncharacterized protein LOC107036027 [Diachasma alloeum]
MNVNIKSSLMLDRRIRIEENGLLEDRRPERHPPEQSTPKRPKPQSQDALTQEYRTSPLLLTQDTNNEVAWDWQSPQTKTKPKAKPEASSTPKRPRLVHKKRNSNSPLVYKPFKKRIIKREDSASLDQWKNEFLALNARIETVASHESSTENVELNEIADELVFDDDFENENDVIVITDSPDDPKITKVDSKEKESLEDLFNDSLNDESMLRCSQEIEAKLNIGPARGSSAPKNPQKPPVSAPSPSASRFKKHKSEPIDKNPSRDLGASSKDFKASDFIDLDDLVFPDDSFDDLVKAACATTAKYEDTTTGKQKEERSETVSVGSSGSSGGGSGSGHQRKDFQGKMSAKGTSAVPQRANMQRGGFSGNRGAPGTQMASGNDRRFFKSRNRSDSSFDSSSRLSSMNSYSGFSVGARGGKTSSTSVSTQMMDLRRTQSAIDRKNFFMTKENSNCGINNFDRLRVRDDGNTVVSSGSSRSQAQCTPEEIERKRIEAKMKLEAKRKMQMTQNSVKR